jgi:hypothetical protein
MDADGELQENEDEDLEGAIQSFLLASFYVNFFLLNY